MAPSRSTFGPYVIHEELGVGGMATVHRAELSGAQGQVALKRMLPALADSEEGLSSFLREARLASYLRHPNVALTYEVGQISGTYFIAMELIHGHTLHAIMNRCAAMSSPMPVTVACALLIEILDALDYAHNLADPAGQPLGIIHRDVSPSNVIVTSDTGIAKLIDFGIAKASAAGMQTMNLTLKGKWAYMAPEYVEQGQIDARADLFAVGVMAHELLVCRPLFSAADDVATLTNLRTLQIPLPSRANPSVPHELDQVVMGALARNPNERWQTAAAMRHALATVTTQMNLDSPPGYVAHWLGDLFGGFSQFDDGAPTMAGAMAYEDPAESVPQGQAYNPAVLDLAAMPPIADTSPMPAYNPPQEELLELAPAPAGTPIRGPATPQGTPAPQMSRPPGRMATPPAASPVARTPTPTGGPRMPTPAAGNARMPTPAAGNARMPTPAAGNVRMPTPAAGNARMPTPATGDAVVPSRTATPVAGSPVPRTRTPSGNNPAVPRRATPATASPIAPALDLEAELLAAGHVPVNPPGVPRDFDPPMPGSVPRDFDPPMPGSVPRDFDPPMPPRNEFSAPEVPADSRPLGEMMTSETTMGLAYQDPVAPKPPPSALPTPPPNTMRTKAPRASTGAEPLWDIGGLSMKIEPLTKRPDAPTTAPVVVTVHKDKPKRAPIPEGTKRVLIIAAAVIVTLGLAALVLALF